VVPLRGSPTTNSGRASSHPFPLASEEAFVEGAADQPQGVEVVFHAVAQPRPPRIGARTQRREGAGMQAQVLAFLGQRVVQAYPCRMAVGQPGQLRFECVDVVVVRTLPAQRGAVVPGGIVLRRQFDRAIEQALGGGQLAHGDQRRGVVVQAAGIVWPQGDGLRVAALGLPVQAELGVAQAQFLQQVGLAVGGPGQCVQCRDAAGGVAGLPVPVDAPQRIGVRQRSLWRGRRVHVRSGS
jgi:hypothetical protein